MFGEQKKIRVRLFTLGMLTLLILTNACVHVREQTSKRVDQDGWSEMDAILRRIVAPTFPARDYLVTQFGAIGDGKTDCREAIAKAIAACTKAGGGRVVVPPGNYLCEGPIHLADNVNLNIGEGATIKFGVDPVHYLPPVLTRFEGTLLYAYSPRIYARGAKNVAITGKGLIDGNGLATRNFMAGKKGGGSGTLRNMGSTGVPLDQRIFGEGKWLRPSMIQPFECTNVLIEDVTIKDSTFWVVHPVFCRNLTVRGIHVESLNSNNDGVDPDSCADVLIENCFLHTGDDSIAIKSGRDLDGRTVARPSENIVIRNVELGSRHGGICIGSEMSGGARNIFIEDCRVNSVDAALYYKGNLDRGGLVEHVRARRITAKTVSSGLVRFQTDYKETGKHNFAPTFRDFVFEDLACDQARSCAINIAGLPGAPIRDVTIRRAKVAKAGTPYILEEASNIRLDGVEVNGQILPSTPPQTPKKAKKAKLGGENLE